jgi:hypothetical protein
MKVYSYHPSTGIYTSTEEADPDPLVDSRWLVPANATTIQPPSTAQDELAVFNEKDNSWEVIKGKKVKPHYKQLRRREYPSIFEYIDGIVKNDHDQINKYINKCLAVKAKYPKPQITDYEI